MQWSKEIKTSLGGQLAITSLKCFQEGLIISRSQTAMKCAKIGNLGIVQKSKTWEYCLDNDE